MQDTVIEAKNLSKVFHEQTGAKTFKETFVGAGRKITGKKDKRLKKGDFTALKDINFEVKKGEFFGIVGRNGCGKSTLLKILAGVYTPTKGRVSVFGKLTPFIELGVGFNPELSGRDNVYLNGALLGFTRKEMNAMYNDIIAFAELEDFMDIKLKNYSSGMQVRLAFSVAIRAQTDILLIDEVLAVGDAAFQRKCYKYFESLKNGSTTVVFISHDMGAIKQFCTKAMFIKDGELLKIGDPSDIAFEYDKDNLGTAEAGASSEFDVKILKGNAENNIFKIGDKATIKLSWPKLNNIKIAGIVILKNNEVVFATNTINVKDLTNKNEAKIDINLDIGPGAYKIYSVLFGKDRNDPVAYNNSEDFVISSGKLSGVNGEEWEGIKYLENKWVGNEG